jgi:rRNA processing protein Krr1/Pno1
MNTNNPVAGFSAKDIIKKFHWLIDNGLSIEEAIQIIKSQTNLESVIEYLDNYLKSRRKV